MTDQDFVVYRGQAKQLNFVVDPVADITGFSISFSAARALGSSVKAIGPLAATITSAPSGTYRVSLSAALTNIRPGAYRYDAWRTNAGFEEQLAAGTLTVADVVRLP